MGVTVACIASEKINHPLDADRIEGRRLGPCKTPLGDSHGVFLCDAREPAFYFLPRYGSTADAGRSGGVDPRAGLYALKDLGAEAVIEWSPAAAIVHTMTIGDLVVPTDLYDATHRRPQTYFEDAPWGALRQLPVFCPTLRRAAGQALHEMKLVYHGAGTVAVTDGPRLETPAEIRMLAHVGTELVTHSFAPEVFLAKELQLCYAAICYVVSYAETGSPHRPLTVGNLFGGPAHVSEDQRLASTVAAMGEIVRNIITAMDAAPRECRCESTMADHIRRYDLPDDWRGWFA